MGKKEKEDTARKNTMKALVHLRNDHKVASVLIWVTSQGTGFFGTDNLKAKAEKAFKCKCACTCDANNDGLWQDVIEEDEKTLTGKNRVPAFDPGMDLLTHMEMDMSIEKLPMKLSLMVYNDLAKWLRKQIVLNRHERGYTGNKIKYSDMTWCPSFWPNDLIQWQDVPNFSHWKASSYHGEGDLTFVLKKAAENRLVEKDVDDPENYVKTNVDKQKEKRKEKWRGKHSNSDVNCKFFNFFVQGFCMHHPWWLLQA